MKISFVFLGLDWFLVTIYFVFLGVYFSPLNTVRNMRTDESEYDERKTKMYN